jgi:NAD(P)H-binding
VVDTDNDVDHTGQRANRAFRGGREVPCIMQPGWVTPYTILRPAWLTDADEVSYEVTQRDEPFKGTEVSRWSVAALVTDIVTHPDRWSRSNLGVNKPGTEGDKPAFL